MLPQCNQGYFLEIQCYHVKNNIMKPIPLIHKTKVEFYSISLLFPPNMIGWMFLNAIQMNSHVTELIVQEIMQAVH